jgi:glycosyltransferase involved in cell wall biosynthesis
VTASTAPPAIAGHLRVVDYVANQGGGIRFTSELVRALRRRCPELRISVAGHGDGLARYSDELAGVDLVDVPPARPLRARVAERLPEVLAWRVRPPQWEILVPPRALEGCDLVWFPWGHRHVLTRPSRAPVVTSLHDFILFDVPGLLPERIIDRERMLLERWFASDAALVVSSTTTTLNAARHFGTATERFSVIPLSADHVALQPAPLPPAWTWANEPYVLLPANTFPHKNHELAIRAVGALGGDARLVLTGNAADLSDPRGAALRALAAECGLQAGDGLVPLGMVSDGHYAALVQGATALIMPTRGEGGGSFPVWEALLAHTPVACSDIPVLREQTERINADIPLLDPDDPRPWTDWLRALLADPASAARAADERAERVWRRSWLDVADDYLSVMAPLLQSGQARSRSRRGA